MIPYALFSSCIIIFSPENLHEQFAKHVVLNPSLSHRLSLLYLNLLLVNLYVDLGGGIAQR